MSPNLLRVMAGALAFFALMLAAAGWRMGRIDITSVPVAGTGTPLSSAAETSRTFQQFPAVVAARDLQPGESLQSSDLLLVDYPVALAGGFDTVAPVTGRQVMRRVLAGQVLQSADFEAVNPLAQDLAPGIRGVAVAIDDVIGIGGHLKPGDKVDVLYQAQSPDGARYQLARRLLNNVTVMSYGNELQGTPPEPDDNARNTSRTPARTAVLAVDTELAPMLLLAEATGRLRLALVGSEEALAAAPAHGADKEQFVVLDALEELLGPSFLHLNVAHDDAAIPEPEPEPQPRQVRQYVGAQAQTTVLQP